MRKIAIINWITFIIILALFYIPLNLKPPQNTRIILEHNYSTYIAPPCFESSNATNYLEETTLSKAIDLGYEAHDSCTEKALESQKNSIISYILKKVGVMDEDWEW